MRYLLVLAATALASLPALADRLPMPADAPPAFKNECGSCHLAFPPVLLAADDWRLVMGKLDRHYGDNAALDETTRRDIEAFLIRNAGHRRHSNGTLPADTRPTNTELPRLTLSRWFVREHDEVAAAVWKDPRVGSAANCAACHTRAEAGSFREREIRMPGGRRLEGR